MFDNFEFGPVIDAKLSHLGIALRNQSGNLVSYDKNKKEIVNVDLIDFDTDGMIFAYPCPLKDLKEGDTIRHTNGNIVFITSLENGIHVIDIAEGEKKEILPPKSLFGFDFVTKIVSLIDFSAMSASADNPFGNMLPLMMIKNKKSSMRDIFLMMMLAGGKDNAFDMGNPLMLLALMEDNKGGSESKDFFQMMMKMQLLTNSQMFPIKK